MEYELLDIVDEHDNVVSIMPRSQAYAENRLASLRAVWLLIKNEKNQFWIPRRQSTKQTLPSYLDGSAVGHVSAGESYEQALIRETKEELCFDMSKMPYKLVGKLTPLQGALCFIHIYQLDVGNNFVIDYNKDDFSEYSWMSAEEIIEKAEQGEKIKDTLLLIMHTLYASEII